MKVLIISPHTDDGELGCGATISRLIREGHAVAYMCFSSCGKKELKEEMFTSTTTLDIYAILMKEIPVRNFDKHRQEILDYMIKVKDKFDLVFCPASDDIHQDHQVITREAKRAFKYTRLLGYELPWNSQGFNGKFFYKIDIGNLNDKIKALEKYESQIDRSYFDPEFIKSLAMVRGVQAGCDYAECFEVIRWYE